MQPEHRPSASQLVTVTSAEAPQRHSIGTDAARAPINDAALFHGFLVSELV